MLASLANGGRTGVTSKLIRFWTPQELNMPVTLMLISMQQVSFQQAFQLMLDASTMQLAAGGRVESGRCQSNGGSNCKPCFTRNQHGRNRGAGERRQIFNIKPRSMLDSYLFVSVPRREAPTPVPCAQ